MIGYFIFERLLKQCKSVKMRTKQQAYAHVVKSMRNQAVSRSRKEGYGGKAVLERA